MAQGQELIEVLEVRGVVAQQEGKASIAQESFRQALAATERIPSVMTERLKQRLFAS